MKSSSNNREGNVDLVKPFGDDFLSLVFSVTWPEFYNNDYAYFDPECAFSDVRVDIRAETGGSEKPVGYAEMQVMNRALVSRSRVTEIEAADAYGDKVYEYSRLLFNSYGGIKDSIANQLGILFEEHMYDIAFVMRIVIFPEFRGTGVLKDLFQFMRFRIGQNVLFVGEPFPLQYEDGWDKIARRDGLGSFDRDENHFRKAKMKIRRHYIKNGLVSVPAGKKLLFLVSGQNPNPVLDNKLDIVDNFFLKP